MFQSHLINNMSAMQYLTQKVRKLKNNFFFTLKLHTSFILFKYTKYTNILIYEHKHQL